MLIGIQGSKYFTKCSFNFINQPALGILTHGDELSHFVGRAKFEPFRSGKFNFLSYYVLVLLVMLMLFCCFTSTVSSYGHVGTVS